MIEAKNVAIEAPGVEITMPEEDAQALLEELRELPVPGYRTQGLITALEAAQE